MTKKLKQEDVYFIAHFLSPVELAAYKNNYEPFTYHLAGHKLRVGSEMANELLQLSLKHESIYDELMRQIRDLQIETNGEHAEFLSTSIKDVGLSVRTYHGLYGSGDCRTMLDVAKLGKKRVSSLRMIGDKSIKEIRALFIKAGCVELFDADANE